MVININSNESKYNIHNNLFTDYHLADSLKNIGHQRFGYILNQIQTILSCWWNYQCCIAALILNLNIDNTALDIGFEITYIFET